MQKRKVLNLVMVFIIFLTAVSCVLAVISYKGGFDNATQEENSLYLANKTGISTVERGSIAYGTEEGMVVRPEDVLNTKVSSTLSVMKNGIERISLGAQTKIWIENVKDMVVTLYSGEIFVDARDLEESTFKVGEFAVSAENAVFTVTSQPASDTFYVYSGEIKIEKKNEENIMRVSAGQTAIVLEDTFGEITVDINHFNVNVLSDYQIAKIKNCKMDASFCFTQEELINVEVIRQEEIARAQQEQLLLVKQKDDKHMQPEYEDSQNNYDTTIVDNEEKPTETTDTLMGTGQEENAQKIESSQEQQPALEETVEVTGLYCTIEIRCDTILGNMSELTDGKATFVPTNGIILSTSKICFDEGDTVFDVLQDACTTAGIQLEYSYTPLYGSYYIEGINNLYQFDCGSESGWMYKVNGWFPNYGCSSYALEDGDVIVWCYTCNGLGADVGAQIN